MSRFRLLSDAQWSLISSLLPARTGRQGRPFSDARMVVEAIIYRYRCGIAWRDLPEVFGPWQTVWADAAGKLDLAIAVDSTIARAHQHATNIARHTGGWVELQESADRAA